MSAGQGPGGSPPTLDATGKPQRVFLISGQSADDSLLGEIEQHLRSEHGLAITRADYEDELDTPADALWLLCLEDDELRVFFKRHVGAANSIGLIANDRCPQAMRSYGIDSDPLAAVDDALDISATSSVDLLLCNGEAVFNSIVIGDMHGLNHSAQEDRSLWSKVVGLLRHLGHISFRDYTLATAKGQNIKTAAAGIMVLEHSIPGLSMNLINDDLSLHDGKLNALILAPSSILAYVYYLLLTFFYRRFSLGSLPPSIGRISTSQLDISSSSPMDFTLDGTAMSAREVNLQSIPGAISVRLGGRIDNIREAPPGETANGKETVQIDGLPKGTLRQLLVTQTLPLFAKAEEEEFKELFLALKQNARLHAPFMILMVLSTLLAATGLFQDSAPVIIGAMILAPLMAPIISLSMGVVRAEQYLLRESARTLGFGIITALACSSLFAFFMPLNTLTDEMAGRLNPNLLDLMVAVISGIAGAYANAKAEIAKSLAGVAIAVALVPPLSVTGIGLGWGDWGLVYGSFLLFVTNLVGITLAATVTFVVLGYAPLKRARKGLLMTGFSLLLVSLPLFVSFSIVLEQNRIRDRLGSLVTIDLDGHQVTLDVTGVKQTRSQPRITLRVRSDRQLTTAEGRLLKQRIEQQLQGPASIEIETTLLLP